MWVLHALGYEMPPHFKTLKDAKSAMRQNIRDDVKSSSNHLCLVSHGSDGRHRELKIGSSQGIHTYSEYWIEKA